MKKSVYNITLIVAVILAVIISIIILWCFLPKNLSDNMEKFRGGGRGVGWGGRGGRRWAGPRPWRSGWWWGNNYPWRNDLTYNIYQSPPNNYGNCKCDNGLIENKCLYGNPHCDNDRCICGNRNYWGCDTNSGEWCEPNK